MTDMPTGPHSIQIFLKQRWPILLLVVALLAAVLVFHNNLANPSAVRTWIVFILAAGVVYAASKRFFPQNVQSDDLSVRYVIAFDSVVFIIVGLSATVLACPHWEAALLLSGASLMIGGFFGLLFGYPQGVAQQTKTVPAGEANQQAPNRDKTLLADSAATLGKVITGFTLAKLGTVSTQFGYLCKIIGPVLGAPDAVGAQVLAGVIVAYFLATGFLSGLLLPSYFMSDRF